ncbi:MAG: RluA family pseudouridine synthase [Deltaproteobacteria bacterium]|nr:RluA family pseudouridine synthase [Deltaproteobacteria bacterium]
MPRIIPFVVPPEWDGARVDHFLAARLRRASRTRIHRLIVDGDITLNERHPKAHTRVHTGSRIAVHVEPLAEPDAPMSFGVLYEDASLLVVDKPALLPMHAGGRFKTRTLVHALVARFPGEPLQIAHRLDRETSGCVVVARGVDSARVLKRAFARRLVEKTYTAIVRAKPPWSVGERITIDIPIARDKDVTGPDSPFGGKMVAARDEMASRKAVTHVTLVAAGRSAGLVTCRPVTGRQHQIRAHLALIGFPVAGDKIYGGGASDGLARHALHAARIAFPHPVTGARVEVASALPADLQDYWNRALDS